jgi:hypothetical protein
VRERGERPPDVEAVVFFHALAPPVTDLERQFSASTGAPSPATRRR